MGRQGGDRPAHGTHDGSVALVWQRNADGFPLPGPGPAGLDQVPVGDQLAVGGGHLKVVYPDGDLPVGPDTGGGQDDDMAAGQMLGQAGCQNALEAGCQGFRPTVEFRQRHPAVGGEGHDLGAVQITGQLDRQQGDGSLQRQRRCRCFGRRKDVEVGR